MKCLIVDDDLLICDLLEHFCSKMDAIKHVTTANDGFGSINLINSQKFDLIFLDYDLPDLKGSDILGVVGLETKVIMVTSHADFASDSYNYSQIVDFLVKPLDFARFAKGVKKAMQRQSVIELDQSDEIFIKEGTRLVKVDFKRVLFIKSASNYSELFFEDAKLMTLMPLKEMELKLPNYFQRIHRSVIVNVNKIESIAGASVHIKEYELSISDSHQEVLLNKIKRLN